MRLEGTMRPGLPYWLAVVAVMTAGLARSPPFASPTGLNIIPTADVLPVGVGNPELATSNVVVPYGDTPSDQAQTQFGVPLAEPGSVEVGLDASLVGNGGWCNVKWRFYKDRGIRSAVAIGIQNVGTHDDPQPYLVGFKHITHRYRLHFGTIKNIHRLRAMFGIDGPIGNITTFMADYISGPGNFSTIGVNLMLPYNLQFNPALLIGNNRRVATGYQICLSWQGKLW